MSCPAVFLFFDFLFDSAVTTAFYTLSLHDALPICSASRALVESGLTEVTSSPFIAESVFDRLRYRSEEHTSELQSRGHLVCRLLLEKKKERRATTHIQT